MENTTEQDLIATGRLLYHHQLWEAQRKYFPEIAKDGKSALEINEIPITTAREKFGQALNSYLEALADKDIAIQNLIKEISEPFKEYIPDELKNLPKEQRKCLEFDLKKYSKL